MRVGGRIRQTQRSNEPSGRSIDLRVPRRLALVVVATALTSLSFWSSGAALGAKAKAATRAITPYTTIGPWDWRTYGRGPEHAFSAPTTLTKESVRALKVAWTFPTGDSVTATPTVVGDTVYVGSWDTYFYAINLHSGALRWKTKLLQQNAVTPYPGQHPRDSTSDGGLVTSSAWFQPGSRSRPDLVIFGGGYTLYALNAHTGQVYWRHDYTGRPERPAKPDADSTRIFSSPVVVQGKVLFGVSADGLDRHRGYAVAADLETGRPVWKFETDVDAQGHILNDGCGGVWSSGTVLRQLSLVVFDVADCKATNPTPYAETVIALRIANGKVAWTFRPPRRDPGCDKDFGATVNSGLDATGATSFLGVGSKDGTYYSLDPLNGRIRWTTNVVFGGPAGGFIGTSAYDGKHVVGSTALGDTGNGAVCQPGNPRDTAFQEPSVHALDAAGGGVLWERSGGASFASTTIAGGMSFNGPALKREVQIHDVQTGTRLATIPLANANWGGIAVVRNALVLGLGSTYSGTPAGVAVLTPNGAAPLASTP